MTKKSFLLDTNVLLHDANSLFSFDDNEVILPLPVIEELDRFKKDASENGRNARQVSRDLDRLRLKGVLTNGGVELDNGGRLRVVVTRSNCLDQLPHELRSSCADHQILALALQEKLRSQNTAVLVTKDINLRIKAHAVGVPAEDYETGKISFDTLFSGSQHLDLTSEQIDLFFQHQKLCKLDEFPAPHTCVTLNAIDNKSQKGIGRYDPVQRGILPLQPTPSDGFWGITPRNLEQKFAFELLSHPDIHLVTLIGQAGTRKNPDGPGSRIAHGNRS